MALLSAFRVQNLRSFSDTGWIEQRAITILVGRNSAGKSTLARVYPLLRQSFGERKQSPILWYGEYVDFGQFSAAVKNGELSSAITFSFKLQIAPSELELYNPAFRHLNRQIVDKEQTFEVEVDIVLRVGSTEESSDTVVESLKVRLLGSEVSVKFNDGDSVESLRIDGRSLWSASEDGLSFVSFDSALPSFSFFKERPEKAPSGEETIYLDEFDVYTPFLFSEVRRHVHGNLGDDKVHQLASRLVLASGEQFFDQAAAAGIDQRMWQEYIQGARKYPHLAKPLRQALIVGRLKELLRTVNNALATTFSYVRYVEPLRATAQRYYRKQDLAIGELDAKGTNVAQFLQGLPSWGKRSFEEMCRRLFGFTVRTHVVGGHIELRLEQVGSNKTVNMADAGVGFSQILPILLQLWAVRENVAGRTRATRRQLATLVVEQPELHLHPAFQATLADLFCEMSILRKDKNPTRIVAETHSPALVNRLGVLIATGKFKAEDVQILVVDQDEEGRGSIVRTAEFDAFGDLMNWPFGFFEPEA